MILKRIEIKKTDTKLNKKEAFYGIKHKNIIKIGNVLRNEWQWICVLIVRFVSKFKTLAE